MKARILAKAAWFFTVFLLPVAAFAYGREPEGPEIPDARLYGFKPNVSLESHSPALIWIFFIVLAFICLVVLFKNAKRTHLD